MERDMLPWLKPQIEEEWYMNNIPPYTGELIPNLQIHTQQQNIVDPSNPNTSTLMHHLGSSFLMSPPKSNFSNLLNTNNNINISGTATTTNNDNNNPFGNVFNLESQGAFQSTLPWLKDFEKKMGENGDGEVEGGLNCDSFETDDVGKIGNHGKNEVINYNANNNVGGSNNNIIDNNDDEDCVVEGDQKGKKKKKKKNPSKSRMAERRRRKKLGDRMYILRSAVPKISKMNKVSILGDAVDYLKELQQQINDLQSELESSFSRSSMPLPTGFHTMTPTMSTLPVQVKEELCPSNVPSLKNQPAKVEVRVGERGIVNIHMFCASKPGILLSTLRALDSLGLDVHQANMSCFNDFSLDVFKAEQHKEGQKLASEQIKAALLNTWVSLNDVS